MLKRQTRRTTTTLSCVLMLVAMAMAYAGSGWASEKAAAVTSKIGVLDPTLANLSDEERAWIRNHAPIRVHNESYWPPFNFTENGQPKGYSIDIMNLLADRTGLQVEYVSGPNWDEFMEMMRSGDLDVMLNIVKTPEREKFLLYTPPYAENPNSIVSKTSTPYHSMEELAGKTVSLPKGFFYEEILERDFPQIKLHLVKDTLESMKAVSFGDADAALGELAVFNFLLTQHMMSDLRVSGEVKLGGPEYRLLNIATRRDLPLLSSILNKAVASLTIEEKRRIQAKWFDLPKPTEYQILELSAEEKQYLVEKKSISMCIDPDWMPYEKVEDGKHIGMTADYMKIFSALMNMPITLVPSKTWVESVEFARTRQCDIFSLAMATPERRAYMNFTEPYLSIPLVIATRTDKPFMVSFEDVIDKPLGIVEGYAFVELLRTKYPQIKLVEVGSLNEGMNQVARGELYGFIDTLSTIGYNLQHEFLGELKISGKFDESWELSVGTRNDEPLLNDIFNRAIETLDDKQHRSIMNAWVSISYDQGIDYALVLKIAGAVLLVLGFLFYRHYQLAKYNKLLQEVSVTDKLTSLYNRVKTDQELDAQFGLFQRYGRKFSVVMMDVDHFKKINDNYGHLVGDEALVHVANIIKACSRKVDIVGRWGGEEFLVICPETTMEGAAQLAEHIRQQIESSHCENAGKITLSLGVAQVGPDDDFNRLINRADLALGKAKQKGRNLVVLAENDKG